MRRSTRPRGAIGGGAGRIAVRQMRAEDVDAVAAIEAASFGREAWPREAFADLLAAFARSAPPRGQLWVAVDQPLDEVVGYLGLEMSALGGEADIINIAVAPAHRRDGVGGQLLSAATAFCRRWRVPLVWLRVRESNRGARRFYAKFGFLVRGRFKGYYEDPREDALLMALDLRRD